MKTATAARAACLVLCLGSLGSDCWSTTATSSDGGYVGPGAPSVEVTVDGVHVGPAPATDASYADLTTQRDLANQIVSTDLVIHAVSTGSPSASCDLHFDRFGAGALPFSAGTTTLASPAGASTAQGTTAPVGPLTVVAGMLTLQCSGSMCDGGVLSLTVLDARHVEGFVSATFADPTDGQTSSTVCTFYVPWRTYMP